MTCLLVHEELGRGAINRIEERNHELSELGLVCEWIQTVFIDHSDVLNTHKVGIVEGWKDYRFIGVRSKADCTGNHKQSNECFHHGNGVLKFIERKGANVISINRYNVARVDDLICIDCEDFKTYLMVC